MSFSTKEQCYSTVLRWVLGLKQGQSSVQWFWACWGGGGGEKRESEGAGVEETGIPKYQTNLCKLWEGRGGGASPEDVFHWWGQFLQLPCGIISWVKKKKKTKWPKTFSSRSWKMKDKKIKKVKSKQHLYSSDRGVRIWWSYTFPCDGATRFPCDGATPIPCDGATPFPVYGATPFPRDGATPFPVMELHPSLWRSYTFPCMFFCTTLCKLQTFAGDQQLSETVAPDTSVHATATLTEVRLFLYSVVWCEF